MIKKDFFILEINDKKLQNSHEMYAYPLLVDK